MKKEHEKIIEKMYDDIRQIPGYISGCGASSTCIESYISAAKDLQQAHEYEILILQGIIFDNKFSAQLKQKDVDKAEISSVREYYREQYIKNSELLHEFIEERKRRQWK
ncbi:hypothetical protein [Enterocloster bolteae]|uniref:hypothetical protein n=1 Tax=Enterocloster bolteae TaxID=208479 RepID=UPI0024310C52|nr:hypothetical protein [Enterocloster bolteae]